MASANLCGGIASGVVCADHQHHGFGAEALAFAMLKPIQDTLRCVAGYPKVRDLHVAKILIEHRFACHVTICVTPEVGDRISHKQNFNVSLFRHLKIGPMLVFERTGRGWEQSRYWEAELVPQSSRDTSG